MKSPITLNWPGVVVLVAVLAVIALIEIFGDPGTVTTLAEIVLLGVAGGGALLPAAVKRRDKPAKRPTRIPPLPMLLLAAAFSAALSGCSTGPQTVPQTTPINISCSWTAAPDGGTITDSDCLVDRATSGAEASTQGNVIRDNQVTPEVTTSVSALP